MPNPDQNVGSADEGPGDGLAVVIEIFAIGLRRALVRQHGWNESLNHRESLLGVALGDQAGISADAPANGAKEIA